MPHVGDRKQRTTMIVGVTILPNLILACAIGTTLVFPTLLPARPDVVEAPFQFNQPDQPDGAAGRASDRVIVRFQPGFVPYLPGPGGGSPPVFSPAPDLPLGAGAFQISLLEDLLARWGVVGLTRTAAPLDSHLASRLGLDRFFTLWVPSDTDIDALLLELRDLSPLVETAEGDGIGSILDVPNANDPLLAQQYALRNVGQVIEGERGAVGADSRSIDGWAVSTGSGDVVLAIIDTGVSRSHPDLAGKLLAGQNFVGAEQNDNTDDSWFISHGTACAGIAAAGSNNGIGITGVTWGTMVLPVKVANVYGFSSETICGNGLIWASDHGAKVASISLGFMDGSSFLATAVAYAHARDVVICASSGNTPGHTVFYPGRFPDVIAVSATNNRDELATFSTTGPEVFICAPGQDVLTTWDTADNPNTYTWETGTSMSCPLVAGVACLIRAANPSLSADQVRFILQLGADDLGEAGFDPLYGWGRVNALHSLQAATDTFRSCHADWNRDGRISSQDAFDFLSQYLADNADFNGDGITSSDDFFQFLSAFFSGC